MTGRRSEDYEEKRASLARRIFERLLVDGSVSLSAMADHAGVSRPTLRHYFGDRDGAVRAALEAGARVGEPYVAALAALPLAGPRQVLGEALRRIVVGWRDYGVGRIHEAGLKVGLEDGETGATYLREVLEPALGAVEGLLGRLVEAGALRPLDLRHGALALLGPVVLALLHQHGLGGDKVRPLDLDGLVERLVEDLCRLHAPTIEGG